MFLHPDQDIDKQLQFMQGAKIPPGRILKRYKRFFEINGCFTDRQQQLCQTQIAKFVLITKNMTQFLNKFIEYINQMIKKFDENNQRFASLNKFLYEYEIHSVQTYSPMMNQYLGSKANMPSRLQLPEEQLLFENSKNANLKEDFDNLQLRIINPFIQLKQWLKYELMDIEALQDAIERSGELVKKKTARIAKNVEEEEELAKLTQGKTTVKSIFMNQDRKATRVDQLKESIGSAT